MRGLGRCLVAGLLTVWVAGASAMSGERPEARAKESDAVVEPTATPASRWPVPMPEKWIEHYNNRLAQFKGENAALPKGRENIVFVGDSLTEGFPLEEYFPGRPVLNRGIISDGIGFDERGVLGRMDSSIFDCNPEIIFLTIGVNDLPHDWVTVEECVEGYRAMVERIEKRLPEVKLVLQTLAPTGAPYGKRAYLNPRIEEFNRRLLALAKEKALPVIDLHSLYRDENGELPARYHRGDGLHFTPEAYALWAEKVKGLLD